MCKEEKPHVFSMANKIKMEVKSWKSRVSIDFMTYSIIITTINEEYSRVTFYLYNKWSPDIFWIWSSLLNLTVTLVNKFEASWFETLKTLNSDIHSVHSKCVGKHLIWRIATLFIALFSCDCRMTESWECNNNFLLIAYMHIFKE